MPTKEDWIKHFPIQPNVGLNSIIGGEIGWPVGVLRATPAELKKRLAAASISYQLQLSSIDYTRKKYVNEKWYADKKESLGNEISDFLSESLNVISVQLAEWHTPDEAPLGRLGGEFTLYKVPHVFEVALLLADRGRFLETLPLLRLCLEMIAWAWEAFNIENDNKVAALKSSKCITNFKSVYETGGRIYRILSEFAHWDISVHTLFIDFSEEKVGVVYASVRDRAKSLVLCLILLDVFLEAIRCLYSKSSNKLIRKIQGTPKRDHMKRTHKWVGRIVEFSELAPLQDYQRLLR